MVDETEDEKFARLIEEGGPHNLGLKRIREGLTGTVTRVTMMGQRQLEGTGDATGFGAVWEATEPIREGLTIDPTAVDELQAAANELRSTAMAQSLLRLNDILGPAATPPARANDDWRRLAASSVPSWITQTLAKHPELREPRKARAWAAKAVKAWPQSEGQRNGAYRQELADLSKAAGQHDGKGFTPDYLRAVLEGKPKQ
jgi:hypothetical protein